MNAIAVQDTFLRVKVSKVSLLLELVGELGLVAVGVTHHPALQGLDLVGFENAAHRLELLIHEVQDLTSGLRMVPVGELFSQMHRVVRDLARETGKAAELTLAGEDTEIDKTIVDALKDPLMHLVRNAMDHGLEPTPERIAAGKAEQGRITLSAAQKGQEIHISVADDGRGLNRAAILKRARESGLVGANEEPDDATVWSLIFRAGFSTAAQVSSLSGRGVGMDVVQSAVRALRGRVSIETQAGQGTCTTLIIPLTLAFLQSMVVRAGQRLYAIPVEVVQQVFRPAEAELVPISADGSELVRRQGVLIPVGRLHPPVMEQGDEAPPPVTPLFEQVIIAVQTTGGLVGLPVDEIVGEQQVVFKPLQGQLDNIRGGAGFALLSSGEIAVALDVESLRQELLSEGHHAR